MEQALPDSACVMFRISDSDYADLYAEVRGDSIFTIDFPPDTDALCAQEGETVPLSLEDRAKSDMEFDRIALSIAAYEGSAELNQFSSKFDGSRGKRDSKAKLSKQERRGFALFNGKGKCALCHVDKGQQPLFTDFTFDNLGVPPNPENPTLIADQDFVDLGLGGFLMRRGEPPEVYESELGKMKVPTLRNVDKRPDPEDDKAYTHNGYFKTLDGLVHFYNTRDVKPECPGPYTEAEALAADCWPAPEVAVNVNTSELGDLGLSAAEEAAIVAFMKTLSDGFFDDDHDD